MNRAIIFANGELADAAAARALLQPNDLIVAADGGSRHCRTLGLVPRWVIGDLDSISSAERAALEQAGTEFELYPVRKNETDLELAIRAAQREGAREIILLGALGGRWDQTVANLLLLAHPDFAGLDLCLVDGRDTFWVVRERLSVHGQPGDTLSLLPLAGDAEGVTLSGLEYPLHDEALRFGFTRGISNVLTAQTATISVRRGLLLAVHSRK